MRTAILAQNSQTSADADIASLRNQIETDPENFAAHANLGKLYCELQRYIEAVPELEKAAAANNPGMPGNQINLARAYLGTGQTERGLAILDKAVQGHTWAGDLHAGGGRLSPSISGFDRDHIGPSRHAGPPGRRRTACLKCLRLPRQPRWKMA